VLEGVGAERHARGVLRVIVDASTAAVLGGTAVGPRASEVLAPLAVAVRAGATLDMLATSGLASPTLGELAALAGR
jgi:pyruvate/2-oxoglutarate dehydrogenase complex dihydrolipoamide dehydrogenase (E3) component